MGAVAPVTHWIPEDDLLLKNAVEAGASLESLAKGAVQFSRRFSAEELQERWHSLLYDAVVSAEASALMIEFERSSLALQSKSSKFDSARDTKGLSGKRKADSIRRCYYGMRKRICNETFESTDMNFLAGPGMTNYGSRHEPPAADYMFGNPVSDNFGIQDSNFEVMSHTFPDLGDGSACVAGNDVDNSEAFYTGHNIPLAQNNIGQNICLPLKENFSCTNGCTVEELGQLKEFPVCDLLEAEDLEVEHPAMFGQIADNDEIPISDCGTSFQNFGYPSPLSQGPVWSTIEGISAPTLSDNDHGDKELYMNNMFALPDEVDNPNTPKYGALHSNSNLKDKTAELIAQLSESLMDFSNQDNLFDEVDEAYIDNLGSLLLDSPNASDMPNICASEASIAPDENLTLPNCELPGDLSDKGLYHCSDRRMICSEETMLSSALSVNPDFPELRNGVICCTLNTEDLDVPSNDDVFLPVRMPSSSISDFADWKFHEAHYSMSSSVKDIPTHQKANYTGAVMMKRENSNYGHILVSSQMTGSSLPSQIGSSCATNASGVKLELPYNDAQNVALRNPISQGSITLKSTDGNADNVLGVSIKGKGINSEHTKNHNHYPAVSHLENQAIAHDNCLGLRKNASCSKLEDDASVMLHNDLALDAELGSKGLTDPKPDLIPTLSDKEECPSESDDDVPCFSDVEAMILDMDLGPDDQDIYSSKQVFKYQHKESKRTIIRLEQSADAYMQRAMEASGAFAVLYGRHSKHFIKKPEVLIGRATEDIKVDIDLGREGCGNKISRRQANIKLDVAGSFNLKNLGKFLIHVNGKEVAPNQSQSLTSGCLIEVRGVAFVFETNRTLIKQYVDKVTKGSQIWEQKPTMH